MDMAEKRSESAGNINNMMPSFNREQSSMISVGQIKEQKEHQAEYRQNSFLQMPTASMFGGASPAEQKGHQSMFKSQTPGLLANASAPADIAARNQALTEIKSTG